MKSFHATIYIIGTITILVSLYGWFRTGVFFEHYYGLFIGFTLIVTARLHQTGKIQ